MRVTVIIACHDQEALLGECLASIAMQHTDGGRFLVVAQACGRDSLPQKWNAGLDLVETDYFIPMAADDRLGDGYIEKVTAAADALEAAAVYTDIQRFGDEDSIDRTPDTFPDDSLRTENRYPGVALFHTETVRLLGGYDEELHGWCDWGLWRDLARYGATAVRVPEPLLLYRRHPGNRSASRPPEREAELRAILEERHP